MAAAEGQWRPTVDGSAFPHEHIVQGGSDRFKCAICLQVMEEPVSLVPCGHVFDHGCIERHMQSGRRSNKCPKGCHSVIERTTRLPDIRQLIRETVKTKCPNKGCRKSVTIDELPAHIRTCTHTRFQCMLEDSDGEECGEEVTRSRMGAHECVCENVAVACGHEGCNKRPHRSSLEEHMSTCRMRPVVCECGENHRARDLETHRQTCPDAHIPCSVCSESVPRRLMDAHLEAPENMRVHMRAMAGEVAVLRTRLKELEKENRALRTTSTREIKDIKARLRPAVSSVVSAELKRGATAQVEIADSLELRWTADLTKAPQVTDQVSSAPFSFGGVSLEIWLSRESQNADTVTWGLCLRCLGPVNTFLPNLTDIKLTGWMAEFTLDVNQQSLCENMFGSGDVLEMNISRGITLEPVPALQTSLKILFGMTRLAMQYK